MDGDYSQGSQILGLKKTEIHAYILKIYLEKFLEKQLNFNIRVKFLL